MKSVKEIRQMFLDFFKEKGHHIVPSAPMVIKDDPTLMFTNAGMNQFKDIILGNVPIKYARIADSQKCLRVSGKHNDLEEVGKDTYHHTMFEMLGNWSFGDYFKTESINWAWELLTDVYEIPKERLYITIFEGYEKEGLERDREAYNCWCQHVSPERIINGNKKDNFWEMGDTGPCGPCSEIHVDLRGEEERSLIDGASLVNKDHPQVIEIWNLVFMQYNRLADGTLEALPNKVIDTGMGLERLCMALQGKLSNYDTDVFQPLINRVAHLSGVIYGLNEETDIAMRVISDHIRTVAFSITDGQLPGNAKAGYVIRRILRRAVRYAYTFLGQKEPFMYRLVPTLIESMGEAYPELVAQEGIITKVIQQEEATFLRTLETGIQLLQEQISLLRKEKKNTLSGKTLFLLYDTYGFPTDLTELILQEQGLSADLNGFEQEMQKQKERARNAAQVEATDWQVVTNGDASFIGYDHTTYETHLLRYREVEKNKKKAFHIVLLESPFYAEMGGQVGDTGTLIGKENGETLTVLDTIRENNLPISVTDRLPQNPQQTFIATVDLDKRRATEANHTATHLLHKALRELLGEHVEQKGSYVSSKELRFDFSHYAKLSEEELQKIEERVNQMIRADLQQQEIRHLPIAEAKAMGAMALFGEKYGEDVRVIQYGDSIELCGGTHIPSTGMIGIFKIISESSIAAGIRRIQAVTARGAEDYIYAIQNELGALHHLLPGGKLLASVQKLLEENTALKKEVKMAEEERKNQLTHSLHQSAKEINGIKLFHLEANIPTGMAKDIAFSIKALNQGCPHIFIAGSQDGGKITLTLLISDELVQKGFSAASLVKEAGHYIQGGGGGQAGFATAGGKKPEGLKEAKRFILEKLGLLNV